MRTFVGLSGMRNVCRRAGFEGFGWMRGWNRAGEMVVVVAEGAWMVVFVFGLVVVWEHPPRRASPARFRIAPPYVFDEGGRPYPPSPRRREGDGVGCVVLVWGIFLFAKVRFASFAVHGPFTNGPYGVTLPFRFGLAWPLPSALAPSPEPPS